MRESDLQLPAGLLARVGAMATMPSRAKSLRRALPSILAQVDRLHLYLDKHSSVPQDLAGLPKVNFILPAAGERNLGSGGKFAGLAHERNPCLYFCFDDDIEYGAQYVAHMAAALRRHHYRPIVGLHGAIYSGQPQSYVKDRRVFHFMAEAALDVVVDELGTGVIAFHSSAIEIEPARWHEPNMTDLQLMIDAVRQRVPRICVRRPAFLARALDEKQEDSLYRQTLQDDSRETALLGLAMRHYPARWCASS